MKKKMWRCKVCHGTQDYREVYCKNCGFDLSMGMGEILFINDEPQSAPTPPSSPTPSEIPSKPSPRIPWKKVLTVLSAVAVLVLVVVIARGILVGDGGEAATEPATDNDVTMGLTIDDDKMPVDTTAAMATVAATEPTAVSAPTTVLAGSTGDALAPSFTALAEGYYNDEGQHDAAGSTTWFYCIAPREAARTILKEYLDQVDNNYLFELVDYYTTTQDEWEKICYCFEYTGDAQVTDFSVQETDLVSKDHNLRVTLWNKTDYTYIGIVAAPEIIFVDNGVRTSYTPEKNGATVVGVTLNCYDLMLEAHNFSEESWVPVGYTLGYDLKAAYTGTKTKAFEGRVTSSDENVLLVDEYNFRIYTRTPGTATVTVELDGYTDSKEITVYPVDDSTGTWLELSADTFPANGEKTPITMTIHFSGDISSATVKFLVSEGIHHDEGGEWIKVADHTYSRTVNFWAETSELDQAGKNAILFYMMKKNDSDGYDPSQDIIDFAVATVQKGE